MKRFVATAGALAASVATPTLIVHSLRDPLVPYHGAEQLARVMPNAQLLPLAIPDHGTGLSRELSYNFV